MTIQGVVFDLDGTLLDTLADIGGSVNEALSAMGFPTHELDAYRFFIGDGRDTLIQRALPEPERNPARIAEGARAYEAVYARRWNQDTKLYPGVAEMLDALVARGLPLAVLSNKPHPFTVQCVEHYLSRWSFNAVLGQRPQVPKKPDPAGAFEAAEMLWTPPAGIAYLGDTSVDMRTARAAGMRPLGVLWGFRTADELTAAGAETLLAHPTEFLTWLDRQPTPSGG